MFDIGFAELLLLAIISLLVLGPERLPGAMRTAATWLGRIRRSFNEVRTELERELNTAEFKQDLHNDTILKQLDDTGKEINQDMESVRANLKDLQFDIKNCIDDETTDAGGKQSEQNS
jgi:sec-independent protein translocase protein TatB